MHFVFNVKIDVHSSVSESLIVNTIERGRERRRERERERKREKESERQGDRETQTERHRDRERERERVTLALAHLVSIIGTFIRVYSGTHEQPYL